MTKHQIYISYAEANEDWVIDFVSALRIRLRKRLGEIENIIRAKYMLGRIELPQIQQEYLNNSTYLIVILSRTYIETTGMTEINRFNSLCNTIIVEYDKTEKPEQIKNLASYCFCSINKKSSRYREQMEIIADLVNIPVFPETCKDTIFLVSTTSNYDLKQAQLKKFLETKDFQILPKTNNPESELQQAKLFVQLGNDEQTNSMCRMAKDLGIPIIRWKKNTLSSYNSDNCPAFICIDFEHLKKHILEVFEREIGRQEEFQHKINLIEKLAEFTIIRIMTVIRYIKIVRIDLKFKKELQKKGNPANNKYFVINLTINNNNTITQSVVKNSNLNSGDNAQQMNSTKEQK